MGNVGQPLVEPQYPWGGAAFWRKDMLEDVRKYVEAALEKLTPAKAQELARSVMQGQGREQVAKAAQELLDWSQKNRERIVQLIQREVKTQLKTLGVASREEVDALRKRVRDLERAGRPTPATRNAAKKTTARKRTAAKRSTA